MPKAKTHKATRKRVKITARKKFVSRAAGQNHFNARESSRTTMNKRRDRVAAKQNRKAMAHMMPYYSTTSK